MNVIHIKDAPAGWKENPSYVYIGRGRLKSPGVSEPGYFGNPYKIGVHGTREEVIMKFEEYARTRIRDDSTFRGQVRALYGKTLVCHCKPLACHGDVLEQLSTELVGVEEEAE
jgi:hypothetical protein